MLPRPDRRWTWQCALCLALAAPACRERTSQPPAKLPPCAEFGQRCEFSPGKFGSCVQRDDCHEQNCFVCQSQH
jgi:hypothetical protein